MGISSPLLKQAGFAAIKSLISRFFTFLTPVSGSFFEVPRVVIPDDADFEFECLISPVSTAFYVLGDSESTDGDCRLVFSSGGYLYGSGFNAEPLASTEWMTDGKLHTFNFSTLGNIAKLTVDGEVQASKEITVNQRIDFFDRLGGIFGGSTSTPSFKGVYAEAKLIINGELEHLWKLDTESELLTDNANEPLLIREFDFSSDTQGWSAAYQSELSVVNGRLRITSSGGTNPYGQVVISGLTVGQQYTIHGNVYKASTGYNAIAFLGSSSSTLADSEYFRLGFGFLSPQSFIATSETCYIRVRHSSLPEGEYFEIDEIKLYKTKGYGQTVNVASSDRELMTFDQAKNQWVGEKKIGSKSILETRGSNFDGLVQRSEAGASYVSLGHNFFPKLPVYYSLKLDYIKGSAEFLALRIQGDYPARLDLVINLETLTVVSSSVVSPMQLDDLKVEVIEGSISFSCYVDHIIATYLSPRETAGSIDSNDTSDNVNVMVSSFEKSIRHILKVAE